MIIEKVIINTYSDMQEDSQSYAAGCCTCTCTCTCSCSSSGVTQSEDVTK